MELRQVCRFLPWIGSDYVSGGHFGFRLLILGESHYVHAVEHDEPGLTRKVVRGQVDGTIRYPFFTKVVGAVEGEHPVNSEMKRRFWASVAYYNYVQQPVAAASRKRPTETHWREAQEPFLAVVQHLAPQGIIVFGRELWHRLPRPARHGSGTARSSVPTKTFRVTHNHFAVAGHVTHPAGRGFTYSKVRPVIREILKLASMCAPAPVRLTRPSEKAEPPGGRTD